MTFRDKARTAWLPLLALVSIASTLGVMAALGPAEPGGADPSASSAAPEPAARVAAGGEFPDDWYYHGAKRSPRLKALEGKRAPELTVTDWIGEWKDLEALEGKVVVVDFWGVWCRPCMASIPKNIKLTKKYKDKGLAFVGVHSTKSAARMPQVVKSAKINYPVAVDVGNKSKGAWGVSFWPTYAVVDHKGVVRAIGLKPTHVEKVVKVLLDEMPPQKKG